MLLVLIVLVTSSFVGTRAEEQARHSGRPANAICRPVHGALGRPGRTGLDWLRAVGRPRRPPGCSYPVERSARRQGSLKATRVEAPAGAIWESGTNPRLLSQCRTDPRRQETVGGELFFQPDRDLNAQQIKVKVAYQDDKIETVTLVAGPCDPKLRMPESPLPELIDGSLKATWMGQDGAAGARRATSMWSSPVCPHPFQ